ncbi:MAG: tRNA (adenosine(37)-N6)-dimethylallyltransferase MiaA [Flavobacteriaceae bacterium]|nr:tRNA (adenosine(37)-N6)-dimethylallyltransferase MiaA [Flavobacteriaceae bacterium]
MRNVLIGITGPTASGKTKLSIDLAKELKCDVISCDSRQFYKELKIGTAVPSKNELRSVKHHLIQHISVVDNYTVKDFEKDAIKIINTQFKKKEFIILSGGSNLFLDSVIYGIDDMPSIDKVLRKNLNNEFEMYGIKHIQEKLKNVDPEYYKRVDLNNPRRIIRALEVSITSGKPYSSFTGKKHLKNNDFDVLIFAISIDRKKLYDKIDKRVDSMIKDGLVDEVRTLSKFRLFNALNTVGYKEIFSYLDGSVTLEYAISEIKKNTRRYAKRQITWLRSKKNIIWVNEKTSLKNLIDQISLK